MKSAQIVLLVLSAFGSIHSACKHGTRKEPETVNFFYDFFFQAIAFAVLWSAGAFNQLF